MSNLQNAKRDISNEYFSTTDTVKRYNILKELSEHIDELRKITVQQIESGNFDIVKEDDILSKIHHILSENSFMHIDSVTALVHIDSKVSHVFDELELDSLNFVEFIMEIEEQFDIAISDQEAERFERISDIVNVIMNK